MSESLEGHVVYYKISIIVTFIQPTNQPTHQPTNQPNQPNPTQPNPTQPNQPTTGFSPNDFSGLLEVDDLRLSQPYQAATTSQDGERANESEALTATQYQNPGGLRDLMKRRGGGEADSFMEFLFLLYKWSWTKIIMGNFRFRMNFLLEVGRLVSDHQDLSCKPTFFWRIEYIGAIVRTCKKWFNNPLIWSLPNRVPACYRSSGIAGGSLAHPAPCGTTRATAAGRICGHDQSRKYQGQVRECELMEIVRPFWIFLQCQKAIMAMMRCILGRICQKRWDLLRRFFFPAICWQVMLFGRIRTRSLATKNSNAVNLPHHPVEKHD